MELFKLLGFELAIRFYWAMYGNMVIAGIAGIVGTVGLIAVIIGMYSMYKETEND